MRFRMHHAGNFNKNEKKRKQIALPLSLPTKESRAIASVYILEERASSSDDVLWFFFAALLRLRAVPFPPSFFTTDTGMTSLPPRRAAQVIASTVSQWLMEILIHWPRLLLFSLCTTGARIVFTPSFLPAGSSLAFHFTRWCVTYQFS